MNITQARQKASLLLGRLVLLKLIPISKEQFLFNRFGHSNINELSGKELQELLLGIKRAEFPDLKIYPLLKPETKIIKNQEIRLLDSFDFTLKKEIYAKLTVFKNIPNYEYNHDEFKTFLLQDVLNFLSIKRDAVIQFLGLLYKPKIKHKSKLWKGKVPNFRNEDERWIFCHNLALLIAGINGN